MPPLQKVLIWNCSEAFSQDTSQVRETREEYFKRHSPNSLWRTPVTYQPSSGAWPRPLSYLAQPFMKLRRCRRGQMSCGKLTMHWGPCWRAWNSLEQYPHLSPQRLWAWQAYMTWMHCTTSMGWPTALGGGKEGQNKGTIVSHLQTVHYRLGLMCKKCYSYPSTSSDTLCCHCQQNCQPSGEGGTDESYSSM